ncbi:MAG: ABC transporter permease [Lachnospira pectinoschiza]
MLVTSADTKILFFGKVLAGTIASLCQAGILMLAIVGAYKFNQSAWGGILDMLLDIPANVLVTYALFGLGGVLFYTFIYGAFGALVSKTEDINKSAGSIQMVIMIVYFITLFQLMNIDGIAMKVLSYLPISSQCDVCPCCNGKCSCLGSCCFIYNTCSKHYRCWYDRFINIQNGNA